jgi:hypothetical protein
VIDDVGNGGATTVAAVASMTAAVATDCFWIAKAGRLPGKTHLDLRIDPPPDLAIEVDVTHSSLDRFS